MSSVLILDNYDSFTWNLVQAVESLGADCVVRRPDSIRFEEAMEMRPDRIILSPGPFGPERTGICGQVVLELAARVPILGVCLGMQVIAGVAGARIVRSGRPVHGKAHDIFHDGSGILAGVPSPFRAARYHSLHVDPQSVPDRLEITARTCDGVIMGCRIRGTLAEGVMFHPESFLTENGPCMLANFLGAEARVG